MNKSFILTTWVIILISTSTASGELVTYPESLDKIEEGTVRNITVTVENLQTLNATYYEYVISVTNIEEPWRLRIVDLSPQIIGIYDKNATFSVEGLRVGRTRITFKSVGNFSVTEKSVEVSVVRKEFVMLTVFLSVMGIMLILTNLNLGCQLDMNQVIESLRVPIGPGVGFVSQYVFMPLIAYAMAVTVLEDQVSQLGLFVIGCTPGGVGSNFWTLLLGGNLNLSVTMTVISTVCAIGMMPLWIYTLGQRFQQNSHLTIPYTNLFLTLVSIVGPLGLGLLIQRYKPNWAKWSAKTLKPMAGSLIVLGAIIGIYVNWFMVYQITWRIVVSSLVVAWSGFIFGAVAAKLFGMDRESIIAVSIETAFQNATVSILILNLSLGQPDADMSSIPVISQFAFTSVPLCTAILCKMIHSLIIVKNKK